MTLIFHLGVETRAVRPVAHRLLTSVWKLHEVVPPRSAIHPRFRVPEIVSFWILDFIHVLVTWRRDGLWEINICRKLNRKKKRVIHSKGRTYTIVAIENIEGKGRGSEGRIKNITQEGIL